MKKIKILIIIFIAIFVSSCKVQHQYISFKDDVNKSIIDGFYNNDTTNISKTIYLLR